MSHPQLKVLVIGSGGREHAFVRACRRSPLVRDVVAAPGNGGIAADARCIPVDVSDPVALTHLAREIAADFVIIGPEVPLCAGAADALQEAGLAVYGPNAKAAQLEGSKAFTKEFLFRHGIPCARSETFTTVPPARKFLENLSPPYVIKASGLAAGKGVIIAPNLHEAEVAVRGMIEGNVFGESGHEVVLEEFLDGEEASIHVLADGEKFVQLPASQDHKRVGEGDTGPNTGGMGAYAPAGVITPALSAEIRGRIIEPSLRGLVADGITFRGTLFIGVMVTKDGPKVLEFNVRFGDPETQTLLPLFDCDPVKVLHDIALGRLDPATVTFRDEQAVVVVMCSEGYPDHYRKGDPVTLPKELPAGTDILHAGTKLDSAGELVTSGGRVLSVCARAPRLRDALDLAYGVVGRVSWRGAHFRRDIAARQLRREHTGSH